MCLCAVLVRAEPPALSNSYLPPQEGYSYNAPSIPFPSPSPSPSPSYFTSSPAAYKPPVQSTYRPPQPAYKPPSYPSPSPTYAPVVPISSTYSPPSYSTPKPFSPPRPSYGVPGYEQSGSAISAAGIPGGNSGAGTGGGEFDHLAQPHVPGMPFDFNYAVKDDYYGTDFGHQASSNGDQVRGEYRVLLPDGRLQIVKYVADWKDGYTAEVTYQGEAKYPQPVPGASGGQIGSGGYPGARPTGGYPSPKPSGGYSGAGYSGGSYSQPTAAGYPSSRPTAGYPSSQPTAGYPSSQPTAGYGGAQPSYSGQPISGYGGAQQAAGGYSSSGPDYGSY